MKNEAKEARIIELLTDLLRKFDILIEKMKMTGTELKVNDISSPIAMEESTSVLDDTLLKDLRNLSLRLDERSDRISRLEKAVFKS